MEEITVKRFLGFIENSDRLQIRDESGIPLFVGWAALYPGTFDDYAVKKFRVSPEFRVKDWKEKGLSAPIEPDTAPDYRFNDLDLKLYYVLTI